MFCLLVLRNILIHGPAQALRSMHPAQGRRATGTGYTNTLHYKALQTHYSPFSWCTLPLSSAQAQRLFSATPVFSDLFFHSDPLFIVAPLSESINK